MKMRILIGYDGSESADAALEDLRNAGLPRDVEALVVSVSEVMMPAAAVGHEVVGPPLTSRRVTAVLAHAEAHAEQKLTEAKEFAAKAAERLRSYFPHWTVKAEGIAGFPANDLVNKADEWNADLVVVGSHGRSMLGRFVLGSVSTKVVTDSHHSVRVARGTPGKTYNLPPKIMIGVDGSIEAEHAVRAVGMRVWPEGTEVRVVAVDDGSFPERISGVLPASEANEKSCETARKMVQWAENELRAIGLQVSVLNEKGDPQRVLVEQAEKWGANSIFVGGRKFSGAVERFWLGSVSTALVNKAHCSVEVVRSANELIDPL